MTFKDSGIAIASCTDVVLSSGSADCMLTSLAGGDHAITAEYTSDSSFSNSHSGPLTQTVNQAGQTALIANADSPLMFNTTETLSTTGGSGTGAVSYQVTSGSCTVLVDQLTANSGTGACSVMATKAADANYNAATASVTVTLQKAGQAITVTAHVPGTAAYNTTFNVAAISDSGLGVAITASGACSGSGTSSATITMTSGTGTCIVHYNQAGNSDYNLAPEVTETTAAVYPTHIVIEAATNNGNITLDTSSSGCGFYNVATKTETQVGNNDTAFDYPYGLVEFTLNCAAADVTITFPGDITGATYRKYGPTTPGDFSSAKWYSFSNVTVNSSTSLTLHLEDGQLGDDTAVDGIIVDQGGPGRPSGNGLVAVPTMGEWGMIIFIILAGLGSVYYLRRRSV